jgi:NMT1/THI5 like
MISIVLNLPACHPSVWVYADWHLVLLAMGTTALLLPVCSQKPDPLETVRIGVGTTAIAGLVYIADERGFFKRRGINAPLKDYDTGVMAVDSLLAGAADVATAADFVMVRKSFDHRDLRTFGQIANASTMGIVARMDHGIEKPSDLKGKKIGLPAKSSSEFLLGRFLEREGVPLSGVQMVDLAPMNACGGSPHQWLGRRDHAVGTECKQDAGTPRKECGEHADPGSRRSLLPRHHHRGVPSALSYAYLMLKDERPKVQWELKHASLGKVLSEHTAGNRERASIGSLSVMI